MTLEEEYELLTEEYFGPWSTFYGPKITRRASNRRKVVLSRLKELHHILTNLSKAKLDKTEGN